MNYEILLLLFAVGFVHVFADGEVEETTTLPTTIKPKVTTEKDPAIVENEAIMGCAWPTDYLQRYSFCLDKAGLSDLLVSDVSSERRVQYGVMDRGVLDGLMASCSSDQLEGCVRKPNVETIDAFVGKWHDRVDNYTTFEKCLQSNTEAMNRLCGSDTTVSRIVSGAAGLQLNILNVFIRMAGQHDINMTTSCNRAIASAAHVTAALYLKSEHFRDNSVMCWNAARQECSPACSAFAAQLNCLHSECSNIPIATLQQLGIWQWYFLDTAKARSQCHIEDSKCSVTVEGTSAHIDDVGFASLFDAATLKKRFGIVRDQLEHSLHMPFARIAMITLGILSLSCGLCIVLCAWYYGVWGRRQRVTRYSRLLDERISTGGLEGKSLTHAVDDDLDD